MHACMAGDEIRFAVRRRLSPVYPRLDEIRKINLYEAKYYKDYGLFERFVLLRFHSFRLSAIDAFPLIIKTILYT